MSVLTKVCPHFYFITTMRSNSGSAQVNVIGYFIKWLIKKLNHLTLSLTIHIKLCETSARKSECNNISAT